MLHHITSIKINNLFSERKSKKESFNSKRSSYKANIFESFNSLYLLKKNWIHIVGKLLHTHSIPIYLNKFHLIIAVDHSIFANQMNFYKNKIQQKILRVMGVSITKIDIKVKKVIYYKENTVEKMAFQNKISTLHSNNQILTSLQKQLKELN